MKKSLSLQSKSYRRLYKHSRKFSPYALLNLVGVKQITPDVSGSILSKYGLTTLLCLCAFVITFLFNTYIDPSPLYLMFLVAVVISASAWGLSAGLYTTTLSLVFAILSYRNIYFATDHVLASALLLFLFVLSAVGSSFLIDNVKNSKTIQKMKNREKRYAQTLTKLHEEHTKALAAIKARDEFLSIASHELKTPLTSMLLKLHQMLENIRSESLANFSVPKLMKVLSNAEAQIGWTTNMINDMLNVSLIDTGRMDLRREEVDLAKLVKRVAENFSEQLRQHKYKVEFKLGEKVVGSWDRVRVEQAITNLFSNAIKYGKGRPIAIRVYNSGGYGKFSIRDRGDGVSWRQRKNIFDRFKRVQTEDDYKKGLGVGLYITKQIVQSHNGRINLSGNPRGGSTFTIELPLK